MHALPGRHRKGRDPARPAEMGQGAAGRAVDRHAGRVDLRPRPGCPQPRADGDALFSGGLRMSEPIRFTLDGREVSAEPGETIWQVAKREAIDIPHLCYKP